MTSQRSSVAVTGAVGNLGWKLLTHLARQGSYTRLVGLDVQTPDAARLAELRQIAETHALASPPDIEFIACDLSDWQDQSWRSALNGAEAVVHFAAQNPYPEASWNDAVVSMDMTMNVVMASVESGRVSRFVFATSNHVMGRYNDAPLADQIGPSQLTTDLEPGVGTVWHTGSQEMDSTIYAVTKITGERICQGFGRQTAGRVTFACVRIGWCQPGENRPETLSASGSPTLQGGPQSDMDPATLARTERWFKGMWLSNRDFVQLFERAILADGSDWLAGSIVVNGMSNNTDMAWSLTDTKKWLSYEPQDNVYG